MAVSYVKFFRGTPTAFANLVEKNRDTLYFISETDDSKGSLYLGSKLISGNISSLSDLEDILIDDLIEDNQILAYDDTEKKWINKSVLEVIGLMIGATETAQGGMGLVPAPGIGQQNAFLRGDGVWAVPDSTVQLKTDNKSISTLTDGQTISLKNFGIQYYKYIPASGSIETDDFIAAHYEIQIVDENNPWKAYLEPKVIEENGELVLGWFEPNPTTIDGVQDQILELNDSIGNINGKVTNLESLLNNNYYTKKETEDYVIGKIAEVDHLIRKTFNSLEEANAFILTEDHPENYIYMILASKDFWGDNNKYDEYIYINNSLEKVGSWETDLSDYVKKQEGYSLVSDTEIARLATMETGAQKNYITSVDTDFTVTEGKLFLNSLSIAKINNLETLLNDKVDKTTYNADKETINTNITSLQGDLNIVNKQVIDLTKDLNTLEASYNTSMEIIMDAITWQDLN